MCLSHHSHTSYLSIDSEDSLSNADKGDDIKQTVEQHCQKTSSLLQRQIERDAKPLSEVAKLVGLAGV